MNKERTWNGPSKRLGYKTEIHRFSCVFFHEESRYERELMVLQDDDQKCSPDVGEKRRMKHKHIASFKRASCEKSMRYVVVQNLDTGGRPSLRKNQVRQTVTFGSNTMPVTKKVYRGP